MARMKSSRIIRRSTCRIQVVLLNMSEIIPKRQELITNPSNVISRIEDFVGVEPYLTEDKMSFQIRLKGHSYWIDHERYLVLDFSEKFENTSKFIYDEEKGFYCLKIESNVTECLRNDNNVNMTSL